MKNQKNFLSLSLYRIILAFGEGIIALFLPVYLYTSYGLSLELVAVFYLVGHFLYAFLIPFGVKFFSRYGIRASLLASIPFAIAHYASIIFIPHGPILFSFLAIIALTANRLLFWVPFHTDFALFSDRKSRGFEIALYSISASIVVSGAPLLGAFLIDKGSYAVMYVVAISIFVLSVIPLLSLRAKNERYTWSYAETYRRLFAQKNWRFSLGYAAQGAEMAVGAVLWPLFIYTLLAGDIVSVGAWATAILLSTLVLELIIGHIVDHHSKGRLLRIGSVLTAGAWVLMALVENVVQLFAVSTYRNVSAKVQGISFSAFFYERAADSGHYVDEYTALREIAAHIGKGLFMLLLIFVFAKFGIRATFVAGALFSLVVNVLTQEHLMRRAKT